MTIGVSTGESYEDEFQYYVQSMQTEEGFPFFQVEEPNLDTLGPLDQLQKKREQQDNFDAGVMRTLRPGKEVPDALPGMIINPKDMDLMKEQYKEQHASMTTDPFDAKKYIEIGLKMLGITGTPMGLLNQAADRLTDGATSPGARLAVFRESEDYEQAYMAQGNYSNPNDLNAIQKAFLGTLDLVDKTGLGGTSVRLYNDIVGKGRRNPVTEQDFTPDELQDLKDLILFKVQETGESEGQIDYPDYQKYTASRSFKDQFNRPTFSENVLGGFKYSVKDGNITIDDKYDFNKVSGVGQEHDDNIFLQLTAGVLQPYRMFSAIGRKVIADTGGEGVPVKINIKQDSVSKDQSKFESVNTPTTDPFEAAAVKVRSKHPTRFKDSKGHLSNMNWEFLAKYAMHKLKQAGEKAVDVFQAPYKAYKGELDPMSPEAIGLMTDLAGAMVFGPMPIARKVSDGTLGSFGGVGAKTLHPQDFVDAKKMDLKGHSREEIWEKTGMWKGNDGIWRHEIPGTPELTTGVWPKKGKLPDYYKHDELYKAYPELKDVNVDLTYTKGFGQLDAPANTIRLNPDLIAERQYPLIMTLGHEIQHWIQRKEGFVTGGSNIEHAGSKVLSAIKNKAKAFADAGDKEGMEMIDLLLTDIEKNPRRFYTYMYRRDPGEVEANLAAHRDYAMTPNQKFKESPMATQKRLEEEHNVAGEFRYPEDQPILAEMPEMIKFSRFDEYTRNGLQYYGLEFNKIYKLENILDNKELYKQYPELRKIKVVRAADEGMSHFDAEKNILHVGVMHAEDLYQAIVDVIKQKTSEPGGPR